ncbi:phosphoglycerate dehydrogenase [Thermospira aquatica]|uniref:D-3-phosphoglycerate dehydrogenase n=1 Tax=Thermospira aquatica TaxID=2828656 RepID=A0AAX3BCS3_9SPIR|nr:phosphoglycerate dehydrogenase [Thermospira aquatica]URA10078.1 phosphoglycerate dehydrogenase [Thermospira aquatica]
MFRILVTDKLDAEGVEILKRYKEFDVVEKETLKGDALIQELRGYDAIIVRSETKLTKEVLEASEGLKIIARAGVGVDNIDVPTATKKGIVVVNAPSGNTISTAEYTFAMMIALARKIPFAHASMQQKVWDRKSFKGVELLNKTLGVIGLGRIGTEVAKRAQAFGMKILGYDPYLSEEMATKLGIELASLERIYKESDFITVHTPLTDATRGLIGKKEIEMMKKSVRIINCARGGIIDEAALAEALKSGRIAGAAVDVYSKEPPFDSANPLLDAPNCILAPHLGASTAEAQYNVAIESAEAVANFLLHGMIVNSVNMPSVSKEEFNRLKAFVQLAERLGSVAAQILGNSVSICLLTRSFLKGLFMPFLGDTVNYVNSLPTAQARGVKLEETIDDTPCEYTNLLKIIVKSDKEQLELWGTVYAQVHGKMVNFNNYFFEATPSGNMLLIANDDVPGVVGRVGTILGEKNINIASMHVGRKKETRKALILVAIDQKPEANVIEQLAKVPGVNKVKFLYVE